MATPNSPDTAAAAYALEASAWRALKGHIPGDPLHDPVAWATWRIALRQAARLADDQAVVWKQLAALGTTGIGFSAR